MIPESGIIEQAIFYRNVGLSVIPVTGPHYTSARKQEERAKQSKMPLVQWMGFQSRFATDEEIESWFTKWPRANIGFVTGRISGVVVADFDSRDAVVAAKQQGYLNTPCVRTGRGVHAYFQYPGGKVLKNFADAGTHMDFRAEGGYTILPPSEHVSGRRYEWIKDRTIGEMPFAPLPDSILKKALVGTMTGRLSRDEMRNLYKGRRKGDRNHTLARLCGSWVDDGLSPEEALEMAEAWNQGNRPPLPHDELVSTIKSIFRYRKKAWNQELDIGFSACISDILSFTKKFEPMRTRLVLLHSIASFLE